MLHTGLCYLWDDDNLLYLSEGNHKHMFTVSEFSRFAQVSPDLLRYYDRINLFKPVHINEQNGYRYYQIEQLAELNRILALKEFGLSLEQISNLLKDDINIDEIQGMLKLQKIRTQDLIQEELQRLQRIESRLAYLVDHHNMPHYEVKSKPFATRAWLYADQQNFDTYVHHDFFAYVYDSLKALFDAKKKQIFVCQIGNWEDVNNWEMGITLQRDSVDYQQLNLPSSFKVGTIPAYDSVASTIFTGKMSDFYQAYNGLGIWIDKNNYQVVGSAYELIYKLDTRPNGDLNTIEVCIPLHVD